MRGQRVEIRVLNRSRELRVRQLEVFFGQQRVDFRQVYVERTLPAIVDELFDGEPDLAGQGVGIGVVYGARAIERHADARQIRSPAFR